MQYRRVTGRVPAQPHKLIDVGSSPTSATKITTSLACLIYNKNFYVSQYVQKVLSKDYLIKEIFKKKWKLFTITGITT